MNVFTQWKRSTAVLAAIVPLAIGTVQVAAEATPSRSATTYTDTTYLQDALSLPANDTSPVIEAVTYDRLQWLLKQSGNFAFLIGDPADTNFPARAQDVETAAIAANVAKIYWYDPNLSGSAIVGGITEPALDTRNSTGITSIASASQTVYGNTWYSLVAQYLGNGYALATNISPITTPKTEGGTITTAADNSVVNDTTNPIFDYRTVGNAEVGTVTDDFFFIYNKSHVDGSNNADKIVASVDLTTEANSANTQADVTSAVGVVGAGNIKALSQGAFFEDEVNAKYSNHQPEPASNPTANSDAPSGSDKVLNDADAADWRIQQITYPQLVHLLTKATTQNAIILFGGTWCPNTRAVLQSVNQYAVENNVPVVYNFDTVLDGGWVGGSTTSATDPLQTRNAAANGATPNANPSSLYGDVETKYLANIATEYDPTIGSGSVTYFPGGDSTKALKSVRKLQVPFLIGYQKGASTNPYNSGPNGNGGVTRQWIQQHTDVNGLPYFTEYMSEPYYTHPQPFGLALNIPHDAAIWSTINSDLSTFTWQSDPAAPALTAHYNTATDADDANYIGAEVATFSYNSTANSGAGSVNAAVANPGTSVTAINPGVTSSTVLSISPTALAAAQAALGAANPATKAAAQTALLAAEKAGSPDATLIGNLATVYSAYSVAQSRKTSILGTWGGYGVQFGLEATAQLQTFFGGLPGGVVSTQTVTANPVSYGTAPVVNIAIANDYGRVPTGSVSLTVTGGGVTVASVTQAVAQNAASFTLPKLVPGTYSYSLSYPGDAQLASFTKTGSLTVTKGSASDVALVASTAPSSTATGAYKVTVATASGLTSASGSVTLTLQNGATKQTVTGALSSGVATIVVPKLVPGAWTADVSWPGDANYAAASATSVSVAIAKAKVVKLAGSVAKVSTSKASGKYRVAITAPSGASTATGKVTVKIKKGSTVKSITGTLSSGTVTVAVPKLGKGTWTVAIAWPGDANYLAASATGKSIKVTK